VTSFDLAGRRFGYHAAGDGPVALLVHGFPLDARVWLDQVASLSDLRTVVAVDLRGFGRSSPVTSAVLTMERHADDLAEVVAAIGVDQVDLAGLSMGGYVALAFAERHGGLLRSLALIGTRAGPDDADAQARREAMADRVVAEGRNGLASDLMSGLLAAGASRMARARLRSMIEATPVETIVAALAGMRARPDRTGVLRRLETPSAVIVGAEDQVTSPAEAEAMSSVLPEASLHVISGAGHLTPLEAPEAVAAALRDLWNRAG
jgi:pimeloyl-ACP methyl ester carboxylesterase